jgi:beta-lactamase class A
MSVSRSRRQAILGAASLLQLRASLAAASGGTGNQGPSTGSQMRQAADRIARLEKASGGRLGVAVVDTANDRRVQHRGQDRFAMCSTFKYLAVAAILQRVDQGKEHVDRWVTYSEADLLEYAPVARENLSKGGLSLGELCAAAVELSDNTAANLILEILQGPATLTRFFRSLGDPVTRLDRNEPMLNTVPAGDERDTTSPDAMLVLLRAVFLGAVLSRQSRQRLESWMVDAKVGQHRVPAGLPSDWRVGHKTGTGSDQTNDVGIIWPRERAPLLFATFYTRSSIPQDGREAVLRDVGAIIAHTFKSTS